MHYSLLAPLLLIAPVAAYTCDGDIFNNFCCVNGHFSGPVVSSFSSSLSTAEASRDASQSAFQSSLSSSLSAAAASQSREQASQEASLSSKLATIGARTVTVDAPVVTARAVFKRTVTSEVSPGLTCIGDSVIAESGADTSFVESSTTSAGTGSAGAQTTSTSSTSTSTGGAAFMTQAPVLAMGVVAAFAYGAM